MKKALIVMVVGILGLGAGSAMAVNNLEVIPAAAMEGSYGLRVNIDPGALNLTYVQSDHPISEDDIRVSFWVDASNLTLPVTPSVNKGFVFMKFYSDAPSQKQHVFVQIRRNNIDTQYRVALNIRKDNNAIWTFKAAFLGNGPHFIEVEWFAASAPGADDGSIELWRDGVSRIFVGGQDNDTKNVDFVRVGIPPDPKLGPLAGGFFDFDSYVSIRPVP